MPTSKDYKWVNVSLQSIIEALLDMINPLLERVKEEDALNETEAEENDLIYYYLSNGGKTTSSTLLWTQQK